MCGTPLDGTTLLHAAIDFDEQEIFELLLAHGADVNARAAVDAAGFGGHTLMPRCFSLRVSGTADSAQPIGFMPAIGATYCGSVSHGKWIHVSCETSVT